MPKLTATKKNALAISPSERNRLIGDVSELWLHVRGSHIALSNKYWLITNGAALRVMASLPGTPENPYDMPEGGYSITPAGTVRGAWNNCSVTKAKRHPDLFDTLEIIAKREQVPLDLTRFIYDCDGLDLSLFLTPDGRPVLAQRRYVEPLQKLHGPTLAFMAASNPWFSDSEPMILLLESGMPVGVLCPFRIVGYRLDNFQRDLWRIRRQPEQQAGGGGAD